VQTFKKGITLITATGERPKAFELCSMYVMRFDRPNVPIQWIVVDDSVEDSFASLKDRNNPIYSERTMMRFVSEGIECLFFKPRHRWRPGLNTLPLNLTEAFEYVKYDAVFFIEDDDWYSRHYLLRQYEALICNGAMIVGETPSRYYHVPTKQVRILKSVSHASLCQTGINSCILPMLSEICNNTTQAIDFNLWSAFIGLDSQILRESFNCVGIKGLPGRPGIGIGHTPQRHPGQWRSDRDLSILNSWIGPDVALYYPEAKI
jgi:hypothetical protein